MTGRISAFVAFITLAFQLPSLSQTIANEDAKLVASDAAAVDRFGFVAIDGDTIFVGAPFHNCAAGPDCGIVYVFEKPAGGWAGTLTETARLFATDIGANDRFGVSVSVDGDTVVVGSRNSCASGPICGAAYVFEKPAGGWSGTVNESAKLLSSDLDSFDNFGINLWVSGDTVALTAAGDNCPGGGNACGAAYVFIKPGSGWTGTVNESAKLVASDAVDGDSLGNDISIDADTVVVGAARDDCLPSGSNCGSAYVFVEPPLGWAGLLTENAKLTASDAAVEDRLGIGVSISGSTIVAGAFNDGCSAGVECGAVYVFEKPANGWSGTISESAKLVASDAEERARLGQHIAVVADAVVANSNSSDACAAGDNCGSVYVFEKPAGGWSGTVNEAARLTASDVAAGDTLGQNVSLSGNTLVAASPEHDCAGGAACGAAYVFELPEIGCPDPVTIDYQGFTASQCAVPQNAVTVNDQQELDDYMTDFGFDGTKVKNVKVNFNPAGEVTIISPCEVHLNGLNNYLDVNADKLCVYGRKGITVANDAGNQDRGVTAGAVALISEEGNAGFFKGLELIADEILVQAEGEAKIGLDNEVTVSGTVALISTGDSPGSNAIIRQNSQVDARDVLLMASRGATIGKSATVNAAGDTVLVSTGTAVQSAAEVRQGASVTADAMSQTSGNKSKLGNNVIVTVTGEYHMNADGSCSIAASASINAGSTSGNCLP